MEFWSETKPVARKPHRCEACGEQIEVGQTYSNMAAKDDGQFWVTKQHAECREAEVALAKLHGLSGGDQWIWLSDLEEMEDLLWLQEHHPAAFVRLRPKYSHWLDEER